MIKGLTIILLLITEHVNILSSIVSLPFSKKMMVWLLKYNWSYPVQIEEIKILLILSSVNSSKITMLISLSRLGFSKHEIYILTKLLFKAINEKLVEDYPSSIFNKLSSSEVIINVASTSIVVPTKILSEFKILSLS